MCLSLQEKSEKLCIDTKDAKNKELLLATIASRQPSSDYPYTASEWALIPEDFPTQVDKLDIPADLSLADAYDWFASSKVFKEHALDSYQMSYPQLYAAYSLIHSQLLNGMTPAPRKTWGEDEVKKIMKGGVSEDCLNIYAKLDSSASRADLGWMHFLRSPNWMEALVQLVILRKILNARFAKKQEAVQHLTLLHFEAGFTTLVFNQQSDRGGTTRMLLPVCDRTEQEYNRNEIPFVRVLDMTYGDLWTLVTLLLERFEHDRDLASTMLDVLAGNYGEETLYNRNPLRLGYWRCSFLYNVVLEGNKLKLLDGWGLSKRSRKSADLDASVTVYEAIHYVLTILFLAEPRHALGMWHATLRSLNLIANGHLTFEHLFSALGGKIRFGRLLPGANVLGKAPDASMKRVAMPLVDSVNGKIAAPTNVPNFGELIQFKSKAKITIDEGETAYESSSDHIICKGVYQPLLKVLFIEFLYLLSTHEKMPFNVDYSQSFEVPQHLEGEENDDTLLNENL